MAHTEDEKETEGGKSRTVGEGGAGYPSKEQQMFLFSGVVW